MKVPDGVWLDELRRAQAEGLRVRVLLNADTADVRGQVNEVATSGAYAVIGGTHVPLDRVTHVEPTPRQYRSKRRRTRTS